MNDLVSQIEDFDDLDYDEELHTLTFKGEPLDKDVADAIFEELLLLDMADI
uniref:Uncharacterized protein n=1 Tax=Dulem virus 42 TaxID=3145760 RepID=A0AAU8B9T4_9CAUD